MEENKKPRRPKNYVKRESIHLATILTEEGNPMHQIFQIESNYNKNKPYVVTTSFQKFGKSQLQISLSSELELLPIVAFAVNNNGTLQVFDARFTQWINKYINQK